MFSGRCLNGPLKGRMLVYPHKKHNLAERNNPIAVTPTGVPPSMLQFYTYVHHTGHFVGTWDGEREEKLQIWVLEGTSDEEINRLLIVWDD